MWSLAVAELSARRQEAATRLVAHLPQTAPLSSGARAWSCVITDQLGHLRAKLRLVGGDLDGEAPVLDVVDDVAGSVAAGGLVVLLSSYL